MTVRFAKKKEEKRKVGRVTDERGGNAKRRELVGDCVLYLGLRLVWSTRTSDGISMYG